MKFSKAVIFLSPNEQTRTKIIQQVQVYSSQYFHVATVCMYMIYNMGVQCDNANMNRSRWNMGGIA